MRVMSSLLLAAALLQSPPATQGTPPAGVPIEKNGVTPPVLVTQVQPAYTREAMRALIQGFVTLQFAIETDGSVGDVRVIKSLDSENGLDAAAVAAVKQWKFKPGTVDGKPVRALVTGMLTFSIRDVPPPMTRPGGFDLASKSAVTEWVHASVPIDGLQIEMAYPGGYTRVEAPDSAIRIFNPVSLLSVGVQRPAVLQAPIPFPMPIAQLAQFSEGIRRQQSRTETGLESVAAGQWTSGTLNWLWLEMEARTLNLKNAPPELAAAILDTVDGVHVWAFSASVNLRLVQVMCTVPMLKEPAAREAALASARSDCSEIIKRMSWTTR